MDSLLMPCARLLVLLLGTACAGGLAAAVRAGSAPRLWLLPVGVLLLAALAFAALIMIVCCGSIRRFLRDGGGESGDDVEKAVDTPTGRMRRPHPDDPRIADDCAVCLDRLLDRRVEVRIAVRDDNTVGVVVESEDLVVYCRACGLVLHAECANEAVRRTAMRGCMVCRYGGGGDKRAR
jgi:hypothetical protein